MDRRMKVRGEKIICKKICPPRDQDKSENDNLWILKPVCIGISKLQLELGDEIMREKIDIIDHEEDV